MEVLRKCRWFTESLIPCDFELGSLFGASVKSYSLSSMVVLDYPVVTRLPVIAMNPVRPIFALDRLLLVVATALAASCRFQFALVSVCRSRL